MTRAGAERMSSVPALKVRPRTATVLPATEPPLARMILRTISPLRASFTATAVSTERSGMPWSCAVFISASMSFGKQEPPKPGRP